MVVDSQLHFWQLSRGDHVWLTPDFFALYPDFVPKSIDATSNACGIDAVVVHESCGAVAGRR